MVSKQQRVQTLEQTPVFSRLTKKECQMLAPVFKSRTLANDEVLCKQGEAGDYLAVVVSGKLAVEVAKDNGDRTVVSHRSRNQAVGEMSCLMPSPRSATVRSEGATTVMVLSRSMLDSLRANAPGLFSKVVRQIAYRLAGMLDETNALISRLLEIKRAPTQPRQPSLQKLQESSARGRPIKQRLELSPTGVLKGLGEEERKILRSATVGLGFEPGEVICLEGERAPAAYFIVDGEVEVLKNIGAKNYRLATIGIGGFLGQRALLRKGERSATIRAGDTGTTVLALSRDRFEALLDSESSLAIGFQEAVTVAGIRQLRQANEMAAYLGAREGKDELRGPVGNTFKKGANPSSSVQERVEAIVDGDLDEDDDVESLASAYLETALQDWDLTPSELDNIEVVHSDGQMSAAEKKIRNKE